MNKTSRLLRAMRLAPAFLLVAALGCDADDGDCPDGSETCRCTDDYKCLEGLTCLSDRCVDVFWTPPAPTNDDDDDNQPGGTPGDESVDNVDACEDWVATLASLNCGDVDWSQLASCDVYADVSCDLAGNGYFECLSQNTTCTVGTADVSGWAQCSSLAICE